MLRKEDPKQEQNKHIGHSFVVQAIKSSSTKPRGTDVQITFYIMSCLLSLWSSKLNIHHHSWLSLSGCARDREHRHLAPDQRWQDLRSVWRFHWRSLYLLALMTQVFKGGMEFRE